MGPTWFLEALLFFAILYVVWRQIRPSVPVHDVRRVPGNGAIALFALRLGAVTFVVRIWLPMGCLVKQLPLARDIL